MKKFFMLFLAGVLTLSGCTAKTPSPSEVVPTPTIEATAEPVNEFYTAYQEATARPVAVMVDNDNSSAWPHAGLTDAYLIYEVPVEGGATRLMAFFNEKDTAKIGPVRSSRHYFLDYVLEHDAIYTHFGYSPRAMTDIPALGVNNLNGVLGSDGHIFWREGSGWHTAFTSMEKINALAADKGYRQAREKAPLSFATMDTPLEGGTDATEVKIPYAGFYSSSFSYDEEKGIYKKFMNGAPHIVQEDPSIEVKNIVIMQMRTYPLGDGSARINVDTVGSGEGYYVTAGRSVPITWEKTSRSSKTVWKTADGEEIKLNPGQTWVMLLPSGVSPIVK